MPRRTTSRPWRLICLPWSPLSRPRLVSYRHRHHPLTFSTVELASASASAASHHAVLPHGLVAFFCPAACSPLLLFRLLLLPHPRSPTLFPCDTHDTHGRHRLTRCKAGAIWLKNWAERNTAVGSNPDVGKYIGVYFAFGIGAAALTVVQTLILWIFCSIEVCDGQHSEEDGEEEADRLIVCGSRVGVAQVTREDGDGHLSLAHVLFRRHTSWSHS